MVTVPAARPAPFALEARAVPELGAFLASAPWLAAAPRGRGGRVLVIPGFTAGDISTVPLRGLLRWLGHRPSGWGLGANVGPTDGVLRILERKVDRLVAENDGPIDLVGWSLGGIISRVFAQHRPEDIRQVITLGSPIAVDDPEVNIQDFVSGLSRLAGLGLDPRRWDLTRVPMPSTAVFSRRDGVVAGEVCRQAEGLRAENVEVCGSHSGLAHNPPVAWLIADRLAQAEGHWAPFEPPRLLRPFFPGSS
jgi:pimeloyl-ACP methyl ester carboxylesterase